MRAPCVWGRRTDRRSPDFPERGEPEREARERGNWESRKGEKERGNVTKPIRDGRQTGGSAWSSRGTVL